MSEFTNISFDLPKNQSNVIKVIGVGGGGSNAINHMFKQGIRGVDFIVCNTDAQALQNSPVPIKIQLGVNLTEGDGAGANPQIGHQSAIENLSDIEKVIESNTKMVFITAGMGGGTGTGAAPVIAKLAKDRDILTVGIVTMPFQFEGKIRTEQAMKGIEDLRKQVDSLIVINNNKLREVYGNLGFKAGFSKADEVLSIAARGIAEVISKHYTQNIDLKDARTVLTNSGTAIMGSATATGTERAKQAITAAIDSPLLNDNKITGAKNVLLLIVSGIGEKNEITIDEISEINEYIQAEAGNNANIIMGIGEDETLENNISVTIIATGFNAEQQREIVNNEPKKIIHTLDGEQRLEQDLMQKPVFDFRVNDPIIATKDLSIKSEEEELPTKAEIDINQPKIIFELEVDAEEIDTKPTFKIEEPISNSILTDLIPTSELIKNINVVYETVLPKPQQLSFEIIEKPIDEIDVKEPEFVISKQAFDFTNLFQSKEEEQVFKESSEVKASELNVNDPINIVSVTEVNQSGIIKYTLEDAEEKSLAKEQKVAVKEEVIDSELNIIVKQKKEELNIISANLEEFSPYDMSIEEILKARSEERKRKMKEFNHKFNNISSRIDEIENNPAYKRMGVDITTTPIDNSPSRMSIDKDANNNTQIRSNNSFLHDNVD